MSEEDTGNLPAVVTKAYDVLLWLINHVGKFSCSHRFVLRDRIESHMLRVLESLVLAAYTREKKAGMLGGASCFMYGVSEKEVCVGSQIRTDAVGGTKLATC